MMGYKILVIRLLKEIAYMLQEYLSGGSGVDQEFESLMREAQDFIDIPNQVVEDDPGGHW